MKIFSKIFSVIVVVLTVTAILISAGIMGPKIFGLNPYIATSGSMQPTITTGSLVYVNTKDKNVEVDDIIMFNIPSLNEKSQKTVTHRVIGEENGYFITKGDANEDRDSNPVEQSQIVGTYSYHIPMLGYIYDTVGYKGLIVAAAWIIILNVISIILTYVANLKEKTTEPENAKATISSEQSILPSSAEAKTV